MKQKFPSERVIHLVAVLAAGKILIIAPRVTVINNNSIGGDPKLKYEQTESTGQAPLVEMLKNCA
jgi:hypothetical protein